MTTEILPREQPERKEKQEITFNCRFCGRSKPLSEMRVITRFFPPVVACQECEGKIR